MGLLNRLILSDVLKALGREAAVALIGPRQVGKTTLAIEIGKSIPSVYLDLEKREDRARLGETDQFLKLHQDKLIILDEIHRVPSLFEILRGLIDEGRRSGKAVCRFLLLGSASMELMRQSETLAGRIEYIELAPLNIQEIDRPNALNELWLRGGFPRSLLNSSDSNSMIWRENFIKTFLERDIPMFGPMVSHDNIERLWTMLAHSQGGLLNVSQLGRNLGITSPTVSSYLGLLVDLLLVRRLPPYHVNVRKRLVKMPKLYIRDSGLVHALLGIETLDELLGHPVVGTSYEGMVIESILANAPRRTRPSFYRTSTGVEIDLVLEMGPKNGTWAIEIKRSTAPSLDRKLTQALDDIKPDKAFIVYGGDRRYPKNDSVEVISLQELVEEISGL